MSFNTRARQQLIPTSNTFNGTAFGTAPYTTASAVDATLFIGRTYGLPTVGFMVHNYSRTGVASTYGGVIQHKFTRLIPQT